MFEAAEVGNSLSKQQYESRLPALRVDLINAQYDLRKADFPVIVVLTGDDRAGVNAVLNVLHEWMDARWIQTHVFPASTAEGRRHLRFWRYWQALPRVGQLAVFVGDWSTTLLVDYLRGAVNRLEVGTELDHVERLEQTLVDDGALLLKFWLHLPKKELKRRVKRAKRDAGAALRVDEIDRELLDAYDDLLPVAQQMLRRTSTGRAPWQVVESTDDRFRDLTVAEGILAALTARLEGKRREPVAALPGGAVPDLDPEATVLGTVDLGASLPYDEYKAALLDRQVELRALARRARKKDVATVLVFEGWDAAGKGGAIRRIMHALDARDYRTVPIAAPTEEERAHHYLWRFWRSIPADGQIAIFDRSWYGRVLVERVEGFAREDEWRRAFAEIADFEAQLVEHGIVLVKYWLHVDEAEQLRRFEAREKTPYKKYKIGAEDYRNRGEWSVYVAAVDEMVARTSTEAAPWHIVPANDKRYARVAVLDHLVDALKRGIKRA
jgi:polyphosphate:AMP phosphotransferase